MSEAAAARGAYLGAQESECVSWDELKPEVRERWERVVDVVQKPIYAQRDTLRAELEAAKAERDEWKRKADAVEAVKDMAIKADLDAVKRHRDRLLVGWQKSHIAEMEVKNLNEELAKVKAERDAVLAGVGQAPTPEPTHVEVEALARVLEAAYPGHKTDYENMSESFKQARRAQARAAFAHIGARQGECQECAKKEAELRRHNDKWTGFIQRCRADAENARAALEGE